MALTIKWVRNDASGSGDGSANTSSNAWTMQQAVAGVVAGTQVNIVAGTYNFSAGISGTVAATVTDPIRWAAYGGTPFFDFSAGGLTLNGAAQHIFGLKVQTSTGFTTALNCSGIGAIVAGCHLTALASNASGLTMGDGGLCLGSYVQADNSIAVGSQAGMIQNSILRGKTCWRTPVGFRLSHCHGNVMWGVGGTGSIGIEITGGTNMGAMIHVSNCTLYNCETGVSIDEVTSSAGSRIELVNSLIHSCTNGIKYNGAKGTVASVMALYNKWYNVTNRVVGWHADQDYESETLASDPLPNAASGDFSLPAASSLLAAAFPTVAPDGTNRSFVDVGGLQAAASGGSGSGGVSRARIVRGR